MNNYELMVILSANVEDAKKEENLKKVETLLTNNGIVIANVDNWGVKKYAYPINYKNEGVYVLFNIEAPAEAVDVVSKQFNLLESVVRYMFVRK